MVEGNSVLLLTAISSIFFGPTLIISFVETKRLITLCEYTHVVFSLIVK